MGAGGQKSTPAKKTIAAFFAKKSAAGAAEPAVEVAAEAAAPVKPSASATDSGQAGLPILAVTFGIGHKEHDDEGRSITIEYEQFSVVALYVPNAGQAVSPRYCVTI